MVYISIYCALMLVSYWPALVAEPDSSQGLHLWCSIGHLSSYLAGKQLVDGSDAVPCHTNSGVEEEHYGSLALDKAWGPA